MPITRAYAQAAEPGNFFVAGKNKIINGDFEVNQRGFSSTTSSAAFMFDRWRSGGSGGTITWSQQTFTPGTAPVSGYEGRNYLRIVTNTQSAASDHAAVTHRIEGVRTLAGQTATVSFWARANSGTPKIGTGFLQLFGSGGSPSSTVTVGGQSTTISTSWARYSFTFSVPSISGKTIGTANDDSVQFEIFVSGGSDFNARSGTVGLQVNTFEIWGVQVEAGAVATPFTTATGTLAGELSACQRYYFRTNWDAQTGYAVFGHGAAQTTTNVRTIVPFPVNMRVRPTAIDFPTIGTFFRVLDFADNVLTAPTGVAFDSNQTSTISGYLNWTTSGATANRPYLATGNNSTGAYLGWSAEL